jgi:hypothetical protein
MPRLILNTASEVMWCRDIPCILSRATYQYGSKGILIARCQPRFAYTGTSDPTPGQKSAHAFVNEPLSADCTANVEENFEGTSPSSLGEEEHYL